MAVTQFQGRGSINRPSVVNVPAPRPNPLGEGIGSFLAQIAAALDPAAKRKKEQEELALAQQRRVGALQ